MSVGLSVERLSFFLFFLNSYSFSLSLSFDLSTNLFIVLMSFILSHPHIRRHSFSFTHTLSLPHTNTITLNTGILFQSKSPFSFRCFFQSNASLFNPFAISLSFSKSFKDKCKFSRAFNQSKLFLVAGFLPRQLLSKKILQSFAYHEGIAIQRNNCKHVR